MNPFDWIRSWFIWATQVLVDAAMFCYNFGWPLEGLGDFFNWLSDFTAEVAGWLYDAADWYEDVTDRIRDILDEWDILNLLDPWLDQLADLWEWFTDKVSYILNLINIWWDDVTNTVKGWIDAALEGFDDLRTAWDNFWQNIFPELVNFDWLVDWWGDRLADVQDLINSAFDIRNDLWNGWQEVRDQVIEFFADPLEWLWGRFADWFLGGE